METALVPVSRYGCFDAPDLPRSAGGLMSKVGGAFVAG